MNGKNLKRKQGEKGHKEKCRRQRISTYGIPRPDVLTGRDMFPNGKLNDQKK